MGQDGSYLFDPSDFWTDEDVEMMTYQQVGMYKRLFWHQWKNGSIPSDRDRLARLLCRGSEVFDGDSIAPLLPVLLAPFDEVPGEPGRLRQKRLHETREEWRAVRQRNVESGKRGAKKRWGKRKSKSHSPPIAPLDGPPNGGVHSNRREGKGIEGKREEAANAAGDGKPKRRVDRLVYPDELIEIVPDFVKLWLESRKTRKLGRRTTESAEQKQIDALAKAATDHGAQSVLDAIEAANRGSYQGIFPKAPKNSDRPKPGAQPEDEQRRLDEEYMFHA